MDVKYVKAITDDFEMIKKMIQDVGVAEPIVIPSKDMNYKEYYMFNSSGTTLLRKMKGDDDSMNHIGIDFGFVGSSTVHYVIIGQKK